MWMGEGFQQGTVEYLLTEALTQGLNTAAGIAVPETPDELWEATRKITGLEIPRKKVCPDHSAPFDAFCAGYFGNDPIIVWKASRGFGGKSILLACLAMVEAVTLGASVNLLGGSGEQSRRVHEYMRGDETNVPGKFWANHSAPKHLLKTPPTAKKTVLTNKGQINTLQASQTSVRGPHPQRLRLDECDEMTIEIFDSALGQPQAAHGILEQTVCSSTHQYPDGTMTEILNRAQKKGWPIFHWCYRESLRGWLTQEAIDRKKQTVTKAMWETEYELQEPSAEGRAIDGESLRIMFRKELGEYDEDDIANNRMLMFEEPDYGDYVTAADWAKKNHWTNIVTWRVDVKPYRLVAFRRIRRLPWPTMVEMFEEQCLTYPGEAVHDATGVGDVVDDLITSVEVLPLIMGPGKGRHDMFTEYIKTIENKEIEAPYIQWLYDEHRYCKTEDLYGRQHPPDGFVAMSLANHMMKSGWSLPASR